MYKRQFQGNLSVYNGGGARAFGPITVTGAIFQGNQAVDGAGGGLYSSASMTLSGTQFLNNAALSGGAASSIGSMRVIDVLLQSNKAISYEGGGLATAFGVPMTVSGTRFIGNVAEGSGGGAFSGGVTAITGTQFVSNTSGLYGGGAYALSLIHISEPTRPY